MSLSFERVELDDHKDATNTDSPPPSNSLKGAKPDAKSFFE